MAKILILYYSTYGHIEVMANAVAEGARAAGGEVALKRVPETVPEEIARGAYFKLDQDAPLCTVEELPGYDAIIFGFPTRYGRLPAQMAAFLDQTGPLWMRNAFVGKVGSVFTATATQHGGQETTLISTVASLMHLGMVVVGLPYSFEGQTTIDEMAGASPYGATTITGGQGQRMPSDIELAGARFQGELVARTAAKLAG
ncbi:NAD(P)H:quinone oxidoreductase [Sphingopyxis sp. 550A]